MRKFQIKFIEMHIVNIDGAEKEIVAYQTATTNEVSKKQIISNMDIADDFHNKFLRNGASSIYANVNSSLNLSVY